VTGSLIVFFLSWIFNYSDISWCIISVMLVLTPEGGEAIPLAITRIKANLIGGLASVLCLIALPPMAVTIILAIVLTIVGCYFFNLMAGSRAAIAAVIIIMIHGIEYDLPDFWSATLKRILAVIIGCVIGLLVTLLFHGNVARKSNVRNQEG
jgi:uncharacterized membrane protein YgaE (UPF0421/DUF939 family)